VTWGKYIEFSENTNVFYMYSRVHFKYPFVTKRIQKFWGEFSSPQTPVLSILSLFASNFLLLLGELFACVFEVSVKNGNCLSEHSEASFAILGNEKETHAKVNVKKKDFLLLFSHKK
jgi:hypothetical protein